LTALIYSTGGINSPLSQFYIFHMIIGSLILPGYLIYSICFAVIITYGLIIFGQQLNLLQNHTIQSLYINGIELHTWSYLIVNFSVFAVMMFISVLLANKIANQLYLREKELYESLKKIEEQETEKQNYIIGIVHELKSPIVAVQSLLDLVLNNYLGPISDAVKEKLTRARKRTDESINMINNVLKISKLRLLKLTSIEELNITEIIDSIRDKVAETCYKKSIELNMTDMRENKYQIKGDRVLLELALSNVLNNSIKYTSEYGKILIKLADNFTNVTISICDTGVGIPQNELNKVKGQFYRASNIKNKEYEGTGMGLSLVNEIIKKMKGTVEIISPSEIGSELNPGTCVIIKIPYSKIIEINPIEKIISKANLKI
ncbi:MAG TPA: HAMP domain-containing sensor histidine kinase, partial [Melioribacteraceae bacterium]|nr:HAMP domain-containing sensor histidine kinase [Melioribacteraceae bacterium]